MYNVKVGLSNKLFYEERPYLYIAIGLLSVLNGRNSKLALASGLVLIGCGGIILMMRKHNRDRKAELDIRHRELTALQKEKNKSTTRIDS